MADNHTSEAREWLKKEKLQKYCEYFYRQADLCRPPPTGITIYDCFSFRPTQTALTDILVLWER